MKVTKEKTENSQAFLTIEMEPTEVEESLQGAYTRLVKRARIPGFRKGKAPRPILERYLGKESLLEDALDVLIPDAYRKALKEQAIEAIAQPQIEVAQTEPLIFKAVVPLKPTVKLGDYKSIRMTPEQAEVTEKEINDTIEELRHRHATWEPADQPVDFGNLLVLDIWSQFEEKPFINQKGIQYQVLRDLSFPMPGFAEQLVGMKKDEEKEFKLKFPPDSRSDLAGKEASFKVRVNDVKKELLPELNDKFAEQVNPELKTLDLLRERVTSMLKTRAEEKVKADFEEKVVEAAANMTVAEFPPVLIEAETDQLLNRRFQQGGRQEMEEYLKAINKTEAELREELKPAATKRVIRSLTLGTIAEEQKIEASDAEIDTEIKNTTKGSKEKDKLETALNTPRARESIMDLLITRKTIQRLVETAKGEVK